MDDDNGLELSLGLSCGGASGKAKGNGTNNAGTSSENHNVEGGGDRSAKVIDDFKNFLHPTSQRPADPPSSEPPPQNFFNELSKAPTADAEASTKPLWVEDEALKEAGISKRKFGFLGMNDDEKKKENVDLHEKKTKPSHVSNATDEGSTADNEDVAESEAGGGSSLGRPPADTDNIASQSGFDVDHFYLPYGGAQVPHIVEDKYDYPYDIGLFSRLGLHCYNLEKGTSLKLDAINKYNDELRFTRCLCYHITLEAIDTSNNSLCNFQTCVFKDFLPEQASFVAQTEISRLKVPSGPRPPTFAGPERRWKDDAVDGSYKGKMPKWFTKDEMAAISSNNGQFYELQESDLQGNEWLHMYAEFAFHSKWMAHESDLRPFLPLEIKKVIVQTKEESEPCMKLNAKNAIFYIIFKGNGDPSGAPVEYQAVVRKTMDGIPGHICLEVDCLAYKSS